MTRLLALDTAGEYCSVALRWDGGVFWRHLPAPRAQSDLILRQIRDLLDIVDARLPDLQALAFGRGPGSFTGLRVAASVAQGLAFGAGLGVIAVSDLAALAQGAARRHPGKRFAVAMDARMGEVYWGLFASDAAGRIRVLSDERVCAPGDVAVPADGGDDWLGVGSGWGRYAEALQTATDARITVVGAQAQPDARDLLTLAERALAEGRLLPAHEAVPIYLRDKVTQSPRC